MLQPASEIARARSYKSPGRSSATISTSVAASEISFFTATRGFSLALAGSRLGPSPQKLVGFLLALKNLANHASEAVHFGRI